MWWLQDVSESQEEATNMREMVSQLRNKLVKVKEERQSRVEREVEARVAHELDQVSALYEERLAELQQRLAEKDTFLSQQHQARDSFKEHMSSVQSKLSSMQTSRQRAKLEEELMELKQVCVCVFLAACPLWLRCIKARFVWPCPCSLFSSLLFVSLHFMALVRFLLLLSLSLPPPPFSPFPLPPAAGLYSHARVPCGGAARAPGGG